MTANQMGDELENQLDRSDSFGSPGYEDFDLSSVLTLAQQMYIKTFLDDDDKIFDETEIRRQGFSALLQKSPSPSLQISSDQTGALKNGKLFDLPADFMYSVYEEAEIDKNVCNTTTPIIATVIPRSYNMIQRLLGNKYKKPYYESYGESEVWRITYSRKTSQLLPSNQQTPKRHMLMTDGSFNVTKYNIVYLINPPSIVVDRSNINNQRNCILDESTHLTIIGLAKDLMMERVKEQSISNTQNITNIE